MAKSLWDEFKDLFKTESEKAQEKQEQINNALEREKEILGQLSALEKEYNNSLPKEEEIDLEKLFPSDLGLKEVEYTPDSDEDIAERAEKESALKKKQDANKLTDKYDSQMTNVESNRTKAEESLKSGYQKLQELYDDLRKRTENDVLKRGLARSSIAATQLGDLDEARMASAGQLQASYSSTMADIDKQIAGLENDKQNALEELDIKYALELDERISELKKDRDKTAKQYADYNNQVRKQNADYQSKRQSDVDKYLAKREEEKLLAQQKQEEQEKKYGYTGAKQENYAKRYDIALNFYSSLAPEIAADALAASPNMKYYLGNYYDKLLNSLKSASSTGGTKYYF